MSDKIAYMGRDLEDALQLNLIEPEDIPAGITAVLGGSNSSIINTMVNDLISTSLDSGRIGFSDDVFKVILDLKEFNYQRIYKNPLLSTYHQYFERILKTLYSYLSDLFEKAGLDEEVYKKEKNFLAARFGDYCRKMKDFYENTDGGFGNTVYDYIAGMTDDYAISCAGEIHMPKNSNTSLMNSFLKISYCSGLYS